MVPIWMIKGCYLSACTSKLQIMYRSCIIMVQSINLQTHYTKTLYITLVQKEVPPNLTHELVGVRSF